MLRALLLTYYGPPVMWPCRFPNCGTAVDVCDDNGSPQEVPNFTTLIRDLRAATNNEGMLLTVALRAGPDANLHAEAKIISELVDFINLMRWVALLGHACMRIFIIWRSPISKYAALCTIECSPDYVV